MDTEHWNTWRLTTQLQQSIFLGPCWNTWYGLVKICLPLHFFSSVWKFWALGTLWSFTSSWSRWNMELVQVVWMRCGDVCSFFNVLCLSAWLFLWRQASDIPTSFQSCSWSGQCFGLSQAGRPFSGGLKNTRWWWAVGIVKVWLRCTAGRQVVSQFFWVDGVHMHLCLTAVIRCRICQPWAYSHHGWTASQTNQPLCLALPWEGCTFACLTSTAMSQEQVYTDLCHCLGDHLRSGGSGLVVKTFQILRT